jgi:4-alpha-glucanotransferase
MSALHELARQAGIAVTWRDVNGTARTVSDESVHAVLAALGIPAETASDIEESRLRLSNDAGLPPLVTADVGAGIVLDVPPGAYRITLEDGTVRAGHASASDAGAHIPAIDASGYHLLEIADAHCIIANAPSRAYDIADIAGPEKKLWGLTAQLYALRRHGDAGIGDFGALAEFARAAAQLGADAVAVSPVHALFSADVTRYGPYAPSNRAALNVLHIAETVPGTVDGGLINWPAAAAAKLKLLRAQFDAAHDASGLQQFRKASGTGLETHAIFEALSAALMAANPAARDWRFWPAGYQHPDTPQMAQFVAENTREIAFHAWLQWRADDDLRQAQRAARDAGAKIGLIADLAVGTDPAGSHGWSRQRQVLQGLEIGAPPDLINREGQGWGITAFSPHGLRSSGFGAFIEMLRHALRHAGGVRIDHVMGLARLWVIPTGFRSTEGAYLTMPMTDLIRLVKLESQRHQAIILGEDLGTLPHGYADILDRAGIAGLRVMWFERDGAQFRPPAHWTASAVAMTTTHDLPTVAGWWRGRDIEWRESLKMQGEAAEERAQDRAHLWSAFRESGATQAAQPAVDDPEAVTYAACAHLGKAACGLALLPIEDALSLPEQPNLPGTVDQHPNWRRRLPGDAAEIFGREDVQARLRVLAAGR